MENKCMTKFALEKDLTIVLFKDDLFSYPKYELIKGKIFEKIKNKQNVDLSPHDKIILKLDQYQIGELTSVWDSDTYSYLYASIKQNNPKKLKLIICKVKEYPKWNPPVFGTILKESLNLTWKSTKKEILEELSEKYLNNGKRVFIQEKKEKDQNLRDALFYEYHINIICNNCFNPNFSGARYICCECDNYNLCEYCQKNARINHKPEHTFIKLNEPVYADIQKYNCIFSPNKKLIKKNFEPFEIDIDIINNGENNLKGCFISPIRFGKKYLGCLKKTITEECKRGDKICLEVTMKFDDDLDEDSLENVYEGYFRLMTENGIPFGDIFYIKVIIYE